MIYCCGCSREVEARLVSGVEIYPHRPDLSFLPFWKCDACGNYVGCHNQTKDSTKPLGCIPTPELREARQRLHRLIDPIWRSKKMTRKELYTLISRELGRNYHTADTRSAEEVNAVIEAVTKLLENNC